jgi:hypothetical protein
MASRRKYKAPRSYRDGGAVIPDDVAPMPESASTDVLPPTSASSAGEPDLTEYRARASAESEAAIRSALEATRHAEELQRQAQPRTIAEQIDQLPISDHKKDSCLTTRTC